MRVTLIHNPAAGEHAQDVEKLLRLVRSRGHEVRYQSSKDDGWKKALDEPADLIAVAGGDGTVARVAKRVIGRGVPVAPLLSGTANNVSRALGMADRPRDELVESWEEARRIKLDVGIATGPWGERYFLEGIGAGLFACAVPHVDRSKTIDSIDRPDARVVYALQLLKEDLARCRPVAIKAAIDGKDVSGDYVMFEALTLPYIGPNLYLAPDSAPGDGHFNLVLVGEAERERLRNTLESWQKEKPRLAVLPTHRGKRLTLQWTGFPLHMDDKIWPDGKKPAPKPPARIDVRIGDAVEFLAPPEKKKGA